MSNVLETITKAVCEVVGRIDLPLILRSVMLLLQHTVRSEIPHLRISILYILLHSEKGSLGFVFAIAHASELLQVGLDILLGILTSISRASSSLLSSTLELNFGLVAVADISLAECNQLLG